MSKIRMIFIALILLVALSSSGLAQPVDYSKDVAPILTKYCTGCHNDVDREGKLSLESYSSLLKGGAKGGVVTPGEAELSRLVRVVSGQAEPKMPPEGEEQLKPAEIEVLKAWIAAGAKGPSGAAEAVALVTPEVKLLAPVKPSIHAVALSPDGELAAIARHGEVELQAIPEKKTVRKLSGIRGSVNGIAFSADGKYVAAAAGEPGLFGEATLFRAADGKLVREFRGHKDSLYCVAISPDGRLVATGSYDHTIKLWDAESGKELRKLDGHNGAVFEVAFRADGQVLASASGDRTVKLWNVATGERLDTLKESVKELYSLAFNPDGSRLAAAGVDNRIRVWQITKDAKEGTNKLLLSQFAHETPILRVVWSADGKTLASSGEDRLVKIWNAEGMTIRQTLPRQSDWASGLALGGDGRTLVVGRINGSLATYALKAARAATERPLTALAEALPEVNYGPQLAADKLPKAAEAEPNDLTEQATAIAAPGIGTGRISTAGEADHFRFEAKADEQWILETKAGRSGSPVDTKVEILDASGKPVPRLLLRAVRDSVIEFRGMTGEQRGVRLANWEEMLLNEYVYLSGDVIKLFQQRRGPDADAQFYPENGNRLAFFDTTARAHALGEPAFVVVPYAVGTELPNNGLPVFTVNYENDDDGERKLGKDSRLTFVAPADGVYLARVTDVRGFAGDNFSYELIVRRPMPDFKVAVTGKEIMVNAGSGKPFTVKAERTDGFHGPIRVDISGIPAGYQVTTPLLIQEGLFEATGVLNAAMDATAPTEEQVKEIKLEASAVVAGDERRKEVKWFGATKVAKKGKVVVYLEPSGEVAETRTEPSETSASHARETPGPGLVPARVAISPGGTVTCKLRVERNGFEDRIAFDVANLPHGVIVDDIGLSGVLIPEKQTERTIVLRAEPWVPAQERSFFATAQVEGNQCSLPMMIEVKEGLGARE